MLDICLAGTNILYPFHLLSEAVMQRCVKKVFWKILQNSQEKTSDRVFFFSKVAGLRQNFKEHLFHRTPPVAPSVLWQPSALGDNNLLMLCPFLQPSKKPSALLQFGKEVNILGHSIERRAYSLILKIATMFSFPRVGIGWWILL